MYSIVMMTALTATPDAAQFNGYFRDMFSRNSAGCNGCNGCSGAARYNCSGTAYAASCTGCMGTVAYPTSCSGCSGCCGGSIFGLNLGTRVRKFFEPTGNGCCGGQSYSCTGYSCSGSPYSCFGGPISYPGGTPYAPAPMLDGFPAPGTPGVPFAVPAPAPGGVSRNAANEAPSSLVSNSQTARATVVVKLPADARLFADGRALKLTGVERKFVSPDLPVDQEFVYRFRAEYERDGETVSVTKKVAVRGGTTAAVEFADLVAGKAPSTPTTPAAVATPTASGKSDKAAEPTAKPVSATPEPPAAPEPAPSAPAAAGERATITVKMPPGATLYVDDKKSPSAEPVRSFSTPALPSGREFAYLLKAEIVRNGQPETLSQKVAFRAGERVIVDFTSLGR